MTDLDNSHHFFRHIKKSWTDGDFIEPAAFRLREENGRFEKGLSINWLEYFQMASPQDAIAPLRKTLEKKRTVGGESKFALLNVACAKKAAAKWVMVSVVHDPEPNDPSHSLIKGYEACNDQVAEELVKVIIKTFPAKL